MHTEYTKKGVDWAMWIGKFTVPGGKYVADTYEVSSEFVESAADGKPGQGVEKALIKVGEKLGEEYGGGTFTTLSRDTIVL